MIVANGLLVGEGMGHDGRVAGNHQHGDGFTDGTPDTQNGRGRDAGNGVGDYDPVNGLPAVRAQCQRGFLMARGVLRIASSDTE